MGAPVEMEILPRGILWTCGATWKQRAGWMPWDSVHTASHTANEHTGGPLTVFHAHERSGKNGIALEGQNALKAWEAWKAWIRTQADARP